MKTYGIKILFMLSAALLWSCVEEHQFSNTPRGNFESCWNILDQKYCFFEYKDIDWQDVHDRYAPLVTDDISKDSLFNVLGRMLRELKDGHVNLYSPFNVARYWDWFEDYPDNFSESIQRNYLGTDYRIAGGFYYKVLPDSVAYAYYSSFSNITSELNLDYILYYLRNCKGLIIDVRNNGGGSLANAEKIASRFTQQTISSGYIRHKTGKAHESFSDYYEMTLSPSGRVQWQKPVVVLGNRHSYSATNNFISLMMQLPDVVFIGDRTGGGCGLPFSGELPNGWTVRFSASPIYDAQKELTEFGIDPDVRADMSETSMQSGIDDIIETARKNILEREN